MTYIFTPNTLIESAKVNANFNEVNTNITSINADIATINTNITTIQATTDLAVRYVAIEPVVVVYAANPANTSYVNVDVTAETSANTYAVTGNAVIYGPQAGRVMRVRKDGSTNTSVATQVVYTAVANIYNAASFTVGVTTGQIFEYAVDNADVAEVYIGITGYWETI